MNATAITTATDAIVTCTIVAVGKYEPRMDDIIIGVASAVGSAVRI